MPMAILYWRNKLDNFRFLAGNILAKPVQNSELAHCMRNQWPAPNEALWLAANMRL